MRVYIESRHPFLRDLRTVSLVLRPKMKLMRKSMQNRTQLNFCQRGFKNLDNLVPGIRYQLIDAHRKLLMRWLKQNLPNEWHITQILPFCHESINVISRPQHDETNLASLKLSLPQVVSCRFPLSCQKLKTNYFAFHQKMTDSFDIITLLNTLSAS